MEEKYILQNILTLTKSLINIYVNATVEAANENIKHLFMENLNSTLILQEELFNYMKDKKIYKIKNISNNDIKDTYKELKKAK